MKIEKNKKTLKKWQKLLIWIPATMIGIGIIGYILGIGSFYMFMAVVSDLVKMTSIDYGLLFGFFLFLGLVGTAITMPIKYLKFGNCQTKIENKSE